MDNEDNFADVVPRTRPVLADVTNRPEKRPFSLISGDDGDSHFTKQVYIGLEDSAKKKRQLQFVVPQTHHNEKDKIVFPPKENPPSHQNVSSQKPTLAMDGSEEKSEERLQIDGAVEKFGPPKCGEVETPTISASGNSKFLGLERCSTLEGDGDANLVTDAAEFLKSCTCSFCSKAVKKSQKEASVILQKFSGLKDTVMHDQHRNAESSNLESSLMHQWKSLFVQMENIYAQESSQLEARFQALKDLREDCKNDLELDDNSHGDNH
ncbi:hypothetical protein RJT34_03287 [Clitoria ternatea]|uniref:Uncharacterized protein n=1 Tax=Clitoria ternatea TaxID=43366 RepID=A0AAN9KK07_CLITE